MDKDNDVEMINPSIPKKVEVKPIRSKKQIPNFEKSIKINPFTIEALSEENARYWFFVMKRQLKNQFSWQAIQLYEEVGLEEYAKALNNPAWQWFDMQMETIISMGLDQKTDLEAKTQSNAGEKWAFLKKSYLNATSPLKTDKLMKMVTWVWDKVKLAVEAYWDLEWMMEEFIKMNGSEFINVREVIILYFLNGLGPDYQTFQDNLMSSDVVLQQKFVLNKLKQHNHMRKTGVIPDENASWANQLDKEKELKCYKCQQHGHVRADCLEQNNDENRNQTSSISSNGNDDHGGSQHDDWDGWEMSGQNHKRQSTEDQNLDSPGKKEYDGRAVDEEIVSEEVIIIKENVCQSDEILKKTSLVQESAYRSSDSQNDWIFDSRAISMFTRDRSIFEYMDWCEGMLKIASETWMPIKERGIVWIDLSRGQARLGEVIYVSGLVENLLFLEALHLAGFESQGSSTEYELSRNRKTVAYEKWIGWSTYLNSVKHVNALLVGPGVNKQMQHAQMTLSADKTTVKKQELIHHCLSHSERKQFNNCIKWMDMDDLQLGKSNKLINDNCEMCSMIKKIKMQSHFPVWRASQSLQCVYMDFWDSNKKSMGSECYFLSLIDDCMRFSWIFVKEDWCSESVAHSLDTWLQQTECQSDQMLLIIQTDNATEFRALISWGEQKEIEFEFIEFYTPSQNDVAERFNRVILEIARVLLFDAKIHKKYWKYMILNINYLQNWTTLIKKSVDENGQKRTSYELWFGYQPDLSNLRAWDCCVLYHDSTMNSKLDSWVAEKMFLIYEKSDKQYYILSRSGHELKLVTNPEFCEWENEYCDSSDWQLGQNSSVLESIKTQGQNVVPMASGGILNSRLIDGESSQEIDQRHDWGLAQLIAQSVMQVKRHQSIMSVSASAMASAEEERRDNKPLEWDERADSASQQMDKKRVKLTPEEPAEDSPSDHEEIDVMEMDCDHDDQDEAQSKEKYASDEWLYHSAMELSEQSDEEGCSNKIKECQNKITSQTVNEENLNVWCSSWICQSMKWLLKI